MQKSRALVSLLLLTIAVESCLCVITVQIGGATRLSSLSRQRDKYSCYWNCDLVGCQIASDDDECAYECEKICRVRYDSAVARSGADQAANDALKPKSGLEQMLSAKSGAIERPAELSNDINAPELVGAGASVRLHMPRNASARNFAIWERCSSDDSGKLTEKPFFM